MVEHQLQQKLELLVGVQRDESFDYMSISRDRSGNA